MPSSSCDNTVQYLILFSKEPMSYICTWKRLKCTREKVLLNWFNETVHQSLYKVMIIKRSLESFNNTCNWLE